MSVPPHLLTTDERSRGVRALHELDHSRQAEVRAAMKANPEAVPVDAPDTGMAVG